MRIVGSRTSARFALTTAFVCGAAVASGLAGCGDGPPSPSPSATDASAAPGPASRTFLLTERPTGEPDGIFDVRRGKAGDRVLVVGRVKDIVPGYAAFKMIDDDLAWCGRGENTDDACLIPWDYCCEDPTSVREGTIAVEMRNAAGEPVQSATIGLRPLDLVTVSGVLESTEAGGLVVVVSDGWYRDERPDFGTRTINWP